MRLTSGSVATHDVRVRLGPQALTMMVPMLGLALALGCKRGEQRAGADEQNAKRPATVVACKGDLDCDVCATSTNCECRLKGDPACGPMIDSCFVDPCMTSSASCRSGKCVVRPAAAGPCNRDDQCVVMNDDGFCDVFAALEAQPAATPKAKQPQNGEKGCIGRASKDAFRARCDPGARRCVLEPAGAAPAH